MSSLLRELEVDPYCPDPLDISLLSRILDGRASESDTDDDDEPKVLCRRCARRVCFDAKKLSSPHYYGGEDISLGTWAAVQAREKCPFCRLVVAAVQFRLKFTDVDDAEEVVVDWELNKGYKVNLAFPGTHIAFVFDWDYEDEMQLRRAQVVERSWIDPHKVTEWLSDCQEYHGEACDPIVKSMTEKFDDAFLYATGCAFRLIDTYNFCIVEDVSKPYVALSYVWGGVVGLRLLEGNKDELMETGGLKQYWDEIPQTVKDAISLVKRMEKRYLWVDALCLVQDSFIDVQVGVQMMHMVYGGAIMTIIAAAGKDANAGLPGVRYRTRRLKQVVEEVKPDVEMTILQDADGVFAISHHAHRAWTFQEQLLSQRTLTFLPNGSIVFRCLRAQWSEEDTNELRPEDVTWEPDYLYSALDGQMSTLASFDSLVLAYSKRSLSFQADAQKAFQGLENLLQRDFGSKFIASMPCSAFDLFVIFSGHFNTLQRRDEFPSWSWLGWIGTVITQNRHLLMYLDECREWLAEHTWIIWYYKNKEGELKEVWSNEEADQIPKTARHVTYGARKRFNNKHCPTLDVSQQLPIGDVQVSDRSPQTIKFLHFWTLSIFLKISEITTPPQGKEVLERGTIVDKSEIFCGSVHLDGFFIANEDLDKTFEFIVLSEACCAMGGSAIENREIPDNSRWDIYWVMLIEWSKDGKVAERRGIGQIFQKAVETSLEPGPSWKEIALG